jgi:translation initiation factor 2-alpha kinase 4
VERAQNEAEREERLARAAEQNRLLTEKIQLDASRKSERARQVQLEEEEKRRQESLATLLDGELEIRILTLEEGISVPGYDGSWQTWTLFAGQREALWTTYCAEPDGSTATPGFVKASLPTVSVQVIDFSASYYSSVQGKKRVDAVANEIFRLKDIRSDNVVRIYAVKRDKSPKGWERLIIMVERVIEGGRLRTWLPRDGFEEETAKVREGCERFVELDRTILGKCLEVYPRSTAVGQPRSVRAPLIDLYLTLGPEIDLDLTLLTTRASGGMTLKLAGTGYARRIGDLHRSNPFLRSHEDGTPEPW